MPKKTEKRVRAWAIVVYDDFISNMRSKDNFAGRAIFFDKDEAGLYKQNYIKKNRILLALYGVNPTVVPCTITYSLPSQGKGKKK